jgi:DNA-binding MarR family transcriptional regulator
VAIGRDDLGFLLALASRRWNEILERRFAAAGYGEVRASYGSLLVPLFEEDGLRLNELARRAHLSKQTLTTMARLLERDGLISRQPDPDDARATLVFLTDRAKAFRGVAETVLADLDAEVAETIGSAEAADLKASLANLLEAKR